jgi:hypothetical protein
MTDITTTHLKCLLDQSTPGPWEARDNYLDDGIRPDDSYQMRDAAGDYLGIMHGQDSYLAALAPELAQEVINLRDALGYLIEETRLAAENSQDVIVQKRVVNALDATINQILGDHQ